MRQGQLDSQEFLLKGLLMDLLTLSSSAGQLEKHQGYTVWEQGTELSSFRVEAGGVAFSQTEYWQNPLFPGVQMWEAAISEPLSIWLILVAQP